MFLPFFPEKAFRFDGQLWARRRWESSRRGISKLSYVSINWKFKLILSTAYIYAFSPNTFPFSLRSFLVFFLLKAGNLSYVRVFEVDLKLSISSLPFPDEDIIWKQAVWKISVMIPLCTSRQKTNRREKHSSWEKKLCKKYKCEHGKQFSFAETFTPDWVWPDKLWLMEQGKSKCALLLFSWARKFLRADVYSAPSYENSSKITLHIHQIFNIHWASGKTRLKFHVSQQTRAGCFLWKSQTWA